MIVASISLLLMVAGGLGLFLFGMSLMSDGIKAIAGQRLKYLLTVLTRRKLMAVLLGTLVTMLVQSSSATTVMTVGFVNAGLLTLRQSLCVVLGANIGTTITAWLVSIFGFGAFKISTCALPFVGFGFFMSLVGRAPRVRNTGTILLGFGLLFIGINFLQDAFAPVQNSPEAQRMLIALSSHPLLAVLAGTLLTVLMQSSSASIMTIQVLALQGAFGTDWDVVLKLVIPLILGDNIGTTITAQLAAIRTSRNAKRTAMGHTILNVVGVAYFLPLVFTGWFGDFVAWLTPWELSQRTIMADMATANTLFKVVNAIVFLPAIGLLEALVTRIIPIRTFEAEEKPVVLDERLLDTPDIAFAQVDRELRRMAKIARKAARRAVAGLVTGDAVSMLAARSKEKQTDDFQYEITSYLSKLARRPLSRELSDRIPVLLHSANDLERIGDLAINIVELAERKLSQRILFSTQAMGEAVLVEETLMSMFALVLKAMKDNDKQAAEQALGLEAQLNDMQVELRKNHVRRMAENECTPESGLIFIDLVDNVEKMGDHLTNIAQSVMGGLQWSHR